MGLYDTIDLPDGLELPAFDHDPTAIDWQTKSIDRPNRGTYRITVDGRLLEEEFHRESVPEEERPYYGTEQWDSPLGKMAGSLQHVHEGWTERQYHGVVEFHASIEALDSIVSFETRFTEGRVTATRQCKPAETEWIDFETLVDDPGLTGPPRRELTRTQAIHLLTLLDDLETEVDALEDSEFEETGTVATLRSQRTRRAIDDLKAYLDWRSSSRP